MQKKVKLIRRISAIQRTMSDAWRPWFYLALLQMSVSEHKFSLVRVDTIFFAIYIA